MLVALKSKKENISEYLIYMWYVEDSIRACQLDEAIVEERLAKRFANVPGITEETYRQVSQWYKDLTQMMLSEGKRESGHLQINENILIDLTDLHLRLLKDGNDALYTACYYNTLPIIVELRSKEGENKAGELETCFIALYGVLMLKLKGQEISQETNIAVEQITKFLRLLSEKYSKYKAGELDI